MKILLTRPQYAAEKTAARLRAAGYEVVSRPLFCVEYRPLIDISFEKFQGLVFTSANGVRALVRSERQLPRLLPCYCVGPRTAEAARAAGFNTVLAAEHNVDSLARLMRAKVNGKAGPIAHIRGEKVAGDLAALLKPDGIEIQHVIAYGTRRLDGVADRLKAILTRAQSGPDLDGIAFYSPRTAALFAEIVVEARLEPYLNTVTALCLSGAVAEPLHNLPFGSVKCAKSPSTDALIDLIKSIEV